MNKKIETTKIKVNNFSEMFAEMRKWKNSGGEWKLLEMYREWTLGGGRKTKDSLMKFILSNGGKKVDIVLEKNDYELIDLDSIFGGKEGYQKLQVVFPDNEVPFANRKDRVGYSYSLKTIGEINKEHTTIMRSLNAWNLNDIFKILVDYYQANKTEIDQFTEKNLSQLPKNHFALSAPWLEVGEDDNLFYIWVGKRDQGKGYYRGGGELEISLKKSDLVGKYDENGMKLKDFAGSEGVKELKNTLSVFWMLLTDEYNGKFGNGATIAHYNENVRHGFDGDDPVAWLESRSYEVENSNSVPKKGSNQPLSWPNSNNNQLTDAEKEQISQWLIKNDITKISLENDKLVIEYNNKTIQKVETENQEQQKYHQIIRSLPSKSLSLSELQNSSNSSVPGKNNNLVTGLVVGVIGGVALTGIIALLLSRKKKNK